MRESMTLRLNNCSQQFGGVEGGGGSLEMKASGAGPQRCCVNEEGRAGHLKLTPDKELFAELFPRGSNTIQLL